VFEHILVRFLNRQRRSSRRAAEGLFLGRAANIIGSLSGPFSVPPLPEHSFISGRTGSGKTTLLLRMMTEFLRQGVPFIFVDFHGPATEELLSAIGQAPPRRPVVLLESWADPVIGWNPLRSGGSPYAVVQELVSVFHRRLWPDAWGPRLEELLRMTLLALAEANLTLLESVQFLARPEFRRNVLSRVTLPEVREFWTVRFERLSPSQRSLVTETVLNKLGVFHDPSIKYIVGQRASTLDFDKALASGSTILANLSSGQLRGNNYLLAALLVSALKNAVYRRPAHAPLCGIFLDEFQEMIALEALDDYLRSFRKYQCAVFLGTQILELPKELKAGVFGNCTRFFFFATGAGDAAVAGRECGGKEGDLVAAMLPELPRGKAVVKTRGEPARLLSVTPAKVRVTPENIERGRRQCLALGMTRADIDREIRERVQSSVALPARTEARRTKGSNLPEGYDAY